MKILLATYLILCSYTCLASSAPNILNRPTDFDYGFSAQELRAANNIAKVYELGQKGYVNATLAKKTLATIKSNEVFLDYFVWLKNIVQIYDVDSLAKIKTICNEIANNNVFNNTKSLQATLLEDNLATCLTQYLKKLTSHKFQGDNKEKSSHLSFFKKHINQLLKPELSEGLQIFLIHIKKNNSKGWEMYSRALSEHIVENNFQPKVELLRHLHINAQLTKYIQTNGLAGNRTSSVLFKELNDLSRDLISLADSNDKRLPLALENYLNFYSANTHLLPKNSSFTRVLGTGKSLTRRGLYKDAQKLFSYLIKIHPDDSEAKFELLWTWLNQNDYKNAYSEVIKKFGLENNYTKINDEKLQFWVGYTLKSLSRSSAKTILKDIVTKSPLSFYAIISSKLIDSKNTSTTEELFSKLTNIQREISSTGQLSTNLRSNIKRIGLWGKLDFKPLLQLETDQLFSKVTHLNKQEQYEVILSTSQLLIEQENFLESFKLSYKAINKDYIQLNKTLLYTLFPRPYMEEVSSASKDFDPLIALSLIRQESAFNLRAKSWVGARGLMQLMPATARMYRKRLHVNHLYRPDVNLTIGSKYLSMLLSKYDQNLVYALSAYNAGESRVKKWKEDYFKNDESILHTIENIPFTETRTYVKLIYRNLFFYKLLEKQAGPAELADSGRFNEIFDVSLGFNNREQ